MFRRNEEGYFLAEMLLSLAAFAMAAVVLLPMAVFVIDQTIELRRSDEAVAILYDELMHLKSAGKATGRETVTLNGSRYDLVLTQFDGNPSWEVCIYYEGSRQQNKKCAITE